MKLTPESNQGIPTAYFPNSYCDIESRFQEHNIIINLTFCEELGYF